MFFFRLGRVKKGLQTAIYNDNYYTIAEMVYGENVKIPKEFFEANMQPISSGTSISDLKKVMEWIRPNKTQRKSSS